MNPSRWTDVADLSRLEFLTSILFFCTFRNSSLLLHEVLRNEPSPWKPSPRPVQQLRRRRGWRPSWRPRARRRAATSARRPWPPAPPPTVRRTPPALMLSNVNSKSSPLPRRTFPLLLCRTVAVPRYSQITLIDFAQSKCAVLHSFNCLSRWENFYFHALSQKKVPLRPSPHRQLA